MPTHTHRGVRFTVNAILWPLLFVGNLSAQSPPAQTLGNPRTARSPLTLSAINDARDGLGSFRYDGEEDPPVIYTAPGESLTVTYRITF
jgi:hypothetical protein